MGYFLGFALLIAGYTLVDWGHYRVAHKQASMWWLVSGKGSPPSDAMIPREQRPIFPYQGSPGSRASSSPLPGTFNV